MINRLFSIPEKDPDIRYILGKKGKNNLMVICLNPSTADTGNHDQTSSNIETIAEANGYDGWVTFNLTPERQTHPSFLSIEENITLLSDNTNLLEGFLIENTFDVKDVLLAWGDLDHYFNQMYLKKYAYIILDRLQKHDLKYWCIKKTKSGHPFHPSTQSLNCHVGPAKDIVLKPFDEKSYMKKIKSLDYRNTID
jgi:hypothetical protein